MSFVLFSCGGGRNPDLENLSKTPDTQRVGDQKFDILSGESTLVYNDGAVQGSGSLRFSDNLKSSESAHNFKLTLQLPEESSVTLISNSNSELGLGIEIEILRKQGSSNLNVVARAALDTLDLSSHFISIDAKKEFTLSFDLHNDHGESAHILGWLMSNDSPLFDDILQGRGFGSHWGLKLNKAKVLQISKSDPRSVH